MPPAPLSAATESALDALVEALVDRPWAVVDAWLPEALLANLAHDLLAQQAAHTLHAAGVGHGEGFRLSPEVRSDLVTWLDPLALTPGQTALWHVMDAMRVRLNRRLYLGLRRFEAHLTVYPPGAHYAKHLDQFRDAGHRRVSFVLYLNREWQDEDGGHLMLFDEAAPEVAIARVAPTWGRAVVFFSDSVPHEVCVTRRQRLSATGWFRDDDPVL